MPAATAVHFVLELAIILVACRVTGAAVQRLGQAPVVGEMIAGVLLGPSLLGRTWPDVQHHLFPPGPANVVLYTTAQIGLVLYMFLVGLNFDVNLIRHRVGTAAAVSAAGILAPLTLGALVAAPLLSSGIYFDQSVTLAMAMMFLGASIATTAFPMLARIIYERGLSGTPLGTLALACGAADDAFSWCLLATVLAIHRGSAAVALTAIVGGILYAVLLLTLGRRAFRALGILSERRQTISPPMLSTVLILLMACAWFTDAIGIYAIFGAFILGVAMPSGFFAERLTVNLEPLVTTFLLPLFFVYSGLNTQIGLVDSPALWAVTLGLLVISIAGKGIACTVAARLRKVPFRESLALGSLMNARGLIELILLNIGLEAGIITPTLFTMLVLVAIVTTLMATPVFELVYGRHRDRLENEKHRPCPGSSGSAFSAFTHGSRAAGAMCDVHAHIRVLFAFDIQSRAILLAAGDKAGNWTKWYATNIPIAARLFTEHQEKLMKEGDAAKAAKPKTRKGKKQ